MSDRPAPDASPDDVGPWRARVLNRLDEQAATIVDSVRRLVRVQSISGSDEENSIQHGLADDLERIGLEVDRWAIPLAETYAAADFPGVEVDRSEAWGVVGRLPGRGGGRSLMLNGHVDVVPPGDRSAWSGAEPFSGGADARFVYGRGACDMKAGLVAAQWVVRTMAELAVPLRGDLLLACVQGEEDGGLGTYATLARGWRADACVIPEPTSLDISPANAGSLTFRLHVDGVATHASRRTSGVSAIEKFLPVFAAVRALETERNRAPDPLMSAWDIAYPIEIGTVHAGDWSSTVPDRLTAEGRYGVALGESVGDARAAFESAISEACRGDAWLRDHPVTVEWWGGQFAPGSTAEGSEIVTAVRRAHTDVSTHRQRTWGSPYGSDLRLLTGIAGIPTVHYGPGDARLAHCPDERVPIEELLTAARALAVLALAYCGVG